MTDKAYAVPLHEQLASVPRDSRLIIDDADGKGTRFIPVGRMCHEAADALRARLAQPEQTPTNNGRYLTGYKAQPEPVAVVGVDLSKVHMYVGHNYVGLKPENKTAIFFKDVPEGTPLYTAPPQREWQGLTENEIKHLWYEACQTNLELTSQLIVHLARNIEAKLKEKNT